MFGTSDFKNISDYDYGGAKNSNFLIHDFGEIWLCSSERNNSYLSIAQHICIKKSNLLSSDNIESHNRMTSGRSNSCDNSNVIHRKLKYCG